MEKKRQSVQDAKQLSDRWKTERIGSEPKQCYVATAKKCILWSRKECI